jgi:HEAT repeat protein
MYVRGSRPLALAVFDSETRVQTLRLFSEPYGRVWLSEGVLRYERIGGSDVPVWVELTLPLLLEVGRRLARPADLAGRLAANSRNEPLPAVRLANLAVLTREYPRRPATLEALRHALRDPHPSVRLKAARDLGDEGLAELRDLATDQGGPEAVQAGAVLALGDRLPFAAADEVLHQALRARRLRVAEGCLEVLGTHGGGQAVATLSKVLGVERGPLAVAAAKSLGASGDASAQQALVAALDRADDETAVAAAEALGHAGSARVIPRLRDVERTSGNDELRRAAREAVARIQERLAGASPGQLSLADGESGQLSLTEDERGRVALRDEGETSRDDDPHP